MDAHGSRDERRDTRRWWSGHTKRKEQEKDETNQEGGRRIGRECLASFSVHRDGERKGKREG
jgi:hypothetical protein